MRHTRKGEAALLYRKADLNGISLEATCVGVSQSKWDRLMDGHVRADKAEVERLIKKHCPKVAKSLSIGLYNPYNAYRTDTHLVYVHSSIEYFFIIE